MTSTSSTNTKARALALFEEFRAVHNERADSAQQRLPKRWELLSAEQLCRIPVWDGFAKYLMDYISQSARSEDGFLAVGTQLDYFGAALNAAAARFKQGDRQRQGEDLLHVPRHEGQH